MPIFQPGVRFRYHNVLKRRKGKRSVTAILSLTAMVDMFTVLAIFLLQSYDVKDFVVYTPKEVVLPKASSIKELKPAFVVTVSSKEVLLDKDVVTTFTEVKSQSDWLIQKLYDKVKEALVKSKADFELKNKNKIRAVVDPSGKIEPEDLNAWRKITIQSDKDIDFLTVKKIMYTVSEAGAGEINFAVTKKNETQNQ